MVGTKLDPLTLTGSLTRVIDDLPSRGPTRRNFHEGFVDGRVQAKSAQSTATIAALLEKASVAHGRRFALSLVPATSTVAVSAHSSAWFAHRAGQPSVPGLDV
jgi:hypothetical protein